MKKEEKAQIEAQKKIVEDNKIIAVFMGGHANPEGRWYAVKPIQDAMNGYLLPEGFRYHCDWDWLMPVFEKIKSMDGVYWDYQIGHIGAADRICIIQQWDKAVIQDATHFMRSGKTQIEACWNVIVAWLKITNNRNKL
jgi:hypothetical protein